jgi:hypothetical protein
VNVDSATGSTDLVVEIDSDRRVTIRQVGLDKPRRALGVATRSPTFVTVKARERRLPR